MQYLSRRILYFSYPLVVGLTLWCGFPTSAQPAQAEMILQKMIQTYGRASSYQDSGVVRLVQPDSTTEDLLKPSQIASDAQAQITFRTYYSRASGFRFDWKGLKQPGSRSSTLVFNGRRAYLWVPITSDSGAFELTSYKELWLPFVHANSSTRGAIFFVPTLLIGPPASAEFPSTFVEILNRAENASVVGSETIDGEMCHILRAELSGAPWLLWVGRQSSLLRKTRTIHSAKAFHPSGRYTLKDTVVAEEIHSEIKLNKRIAPKVFRFKPRMKRGDQR